MKLTPVMQKFIVHWGEMGTRWGVNRTVAQIHALLYLSPEPLDAEDISATLGVARSNVSTSLKELQSWGLAKVVHVLGDRRDHFITLAEVWDIFDCIVAERKKRELIPTLELLRQCEQEAAAEKGLPPLVRERIGNMTQFLAQLTDWHAQMTQLPRATLLKLMKLGTRITRIFSS
jgi:DNA-binding transcriptional regulator GbsR (MarR family)